MPGIRKINEPGVERLPAFCRATIAGDQVFVSGMLGAREGALELVPGGVAAQTVNRSNSRSRICRPAAWTRYALG